MPIRKRVELKAAMFEKGYTGKKLAAKVGLNPSTISLVVNGKLNLESRYETQIARILDKPVDLLFGGNGCNIQ